MITHVLKAICVLCTAACAAAAFVSCGDVESSSKGSGDSGDVSYSSAEFDLSAEEYLKLALEKAPDSLIDETTAKGDTSDFGFDNFCEKLYGGLSVKELADGAICYASSGGNADEISILKAADPEKQSELTKILKDRVDIRHHDFEGYKPEELPKIEKARVFEANGFCILIIADNAEDIEKAFEDITEG